MAKNYMTFGQFTCALEEYLIIYHQKPNKVFVNRALAECYAGIPGMEHKAVKHAEFLLEKDYTKLDLWVLALAYHKDQQFEKAIKIAKLYISKYNPVELELENVQLLISNCQNAQELIKFPVPVKFENLGKRINSKWDELNPLPALNEGNLMFTTTRNNVMGGYSFGNAYLPDVFTSELKGSEYSKPRSLGSMFNTIDIDEYAGCSADGKYLFVTTDGEGFQIFNLKMSHKGPRGRSWPKPVSLVGINNNTSNEKTATINNEGNVIIFSSDRPGGLGGYDLWMSRKLPDGNWAEPTNLGPTVNTKFDETFAQFNEKQTGITFASQGHVNMGGFDIFESKGWDDYTKWSTPVNLGYPINSTHDDISIHFLQNKRIAYKSAYREDSYGMSDLYRIILSDSTPQLTILNIELKTDPQTKLSIDSLSGIRDGSLELLDSLRYIKDNLDSMLISPEEYDVDISELLEKSLDSLEIGELTNEEAADSLEDAVIVPDSLDIARIKLTLNSLLDSTLTVIAEQNENIMQTNPNCYAEIQVTNSDTEEDYGKYMSNSFRGGVLMILEPGKYDLSVIADGYYPLNKSLIIHDKNRFTKHINKSFVLRKKNN